MIYYYFRTCFSKQDAFKICTFLAPTNHKSALKQAVRRQVDTTADICCIAKIIRKVQNK